MENLLGMEYVVGWNHCGNSVGDRYHIQEYFASLQESNITCTVNI